MVLAVHVGHIPSESQAKAIAIATGRNANDNAVNNENNGEMNLTPTTKTGQTSHKSNPRRWMMIEDVDDDRGLCPAV